MILCVTYKMGSHTRSPRPIQDARGSFSGQFPYALSVACRRLDFLSPLFCFPAFSEMKEGCSVHSQVQPSGLANCAWMLQHPGFKEMRFRSFCTAPQRVFRRTGPFSSSEVTCLTVHLLLGPPPALSLSLCSPAPAPWVHLLNKLLVTKSQHQALLLGGIQTKISGYKENLD